MNRNIRKGLSTLLILAMLLTLAASVSQTVYAATASTTISSSATHRTVAQSTTTAASKSESSSFGTVYHTYGTQTVITPRTNIPVNASDGLGPPEYTSYFTPHLSQLGLQYSKSIPTGNVSGKINASSASGTYYLYATWSCQRLVQQVITTYSGGSRIDYARTVAYVPCSTSEVTEIRCYP